MAVVFGDCVLDLDRFELRRNGEPVNIEPQAMRILVELIEHRDRVVSKEELLDSVWGGRFVSESALTTQIKAVRRAVGDTGRAQEVLKTVHGRGYMFVADIVDEATGDGATRPVERANPLLAVLPFASLTADPDRTHVAEGLTHDVITALSKHHWLRVLPRATAATYGAEVDPVERLRTELEVHYVVDGTLRLEQDRLRVTVSLTDAIEGTCVWAERYDRRIDDLFDVLDDITDVIAATIEPVVGIAERARVGREERTDLQVWDLFHLAINHFYRFTAADNLEAQRLLSRCRELDPAFGEAHAWWAYAVVLGMVYWDIDPDPATLDEALAATRRALEIDDHSAVFHMLRGRVQLARREYGSALADNERAIELNPTFAAASCGLGDSLCYEGNYDEAVAQFDRAVKLGAHDPQRWAFLSYGSLALLFSGRFEEAIDWAERAMVIPNCQYWSTAHKIVAQAHLGRLDEARAAVPALLEQCPNFSIDHARRKLFYLKRPEQLSLYLEGLELAGVPPR